MLASTSSSSSAAAADMIKARTYDVFISFRGEDIRDGFVSHLHKDLCRKNINTFIDSEKLQRGDEISEALSKAIQGSRVSVIVFSKDYASSKWCLDELVKIMDCNKCVVPVFYGVDPSDVRKQRGNFADAFAKHEENFKHGAEKVKSWRTALTSAGNLSGWDSEKIRPDSTLVDKIVKDILKKLNRGTSRANLEGLVGIERRMQKVLSLFQHGFPDFQILGIWGMGGTGKTTLAEAIFHYVLNGFQSYFFLANVRESDDQGTLSQLRQTFFSTILEDEYLYISTPTIGSSFLKDRLSRKKVLVVCDDVSKLSQLEYLFGGNNRLGPGSRVIVTTRDKQVLIQYGIDLIYEMEELDDDESINLFCQRAFKSNHPTEYHQLKLSQVVLSFANGNPLAIKVIGSSLRGKTQSYQESEAKKLKQVPKPDIQKLLKWSFDGLECEEKEMFLDIACFFKGEDRDFVTRIMEACYLSAYSRIENLIDKSLIYVSENKIKMHDLLQQMGWNIVYNESPLEPERRSRLWIPDDIYDVLIENSGTKTLKGMLLDMSRIPKLELKAEAFVKMRKLKFLKFYLPSTFGRVQMKSKILLPQGLLSLPNELRYLYWEGYPLKTLPTNFDPRNLVKLDMRDSNAEQLWEGKQDLVNLKVINLFCSKNLVRIPDLSNATNLGKIYLNWCSKLCELPPSLQHLEKLTHLDFSYCKNIRSLPSLYKATSLTKLDLSGCSNLLSFPEVSSNVTKLWLDGTAIEEVPSSIECLSNLRVFNLCGCKRLKSLPTSIHKLKSLEEFNLRDCSRLETFPKILDTMERLRDLDLSGTALKELPSSIDNFISLGYLRLNNCENLVCLPNEFYKSKSLWGLDICGRSNLAVKNLFSAIGGRPVKLKDLHGLSSLYKLDLSETSLESLPTTIKQFPRLQELILWNCKRLKSLPELPPSLGHLDADSCTSLEEVSSIKKLFEQALFCQDEPYRCLKLIFTNCFQLNEKGVGNRGTPKLETPFKQMVNVLKDYHQASPQRNKFITCVPGSEIPEWFDFKSLGSSINIQLPSEWWINFPSFVASVVVSFPECYNGRNFGIRCECHLKSYNGDSQDLTCSFSIWGVGLVTHEDRMFGWDHMFLLYDDFKVWEFVESQASSKCIYNEASFKFYPLLYGSNTSLRNISLEIKQCGVDLLFAN